MKRLAYALALALLVSACASAAESRPVQLRSKAARALLDLPFTVTTPDGVELEAGQYAVSVQESVLRQVRRPLGSFGLWPGPLVQLRRVSGSFSTRASFTLKTAFEVRLVYPVPQAPLQPQRVEDSGTVLAPYIRNRQFVGIIYRGNILYITEALPGLHSR